MSAIAKLVGAVQPVLDNPTHIGNQARLGAALAALDREELVEGVAGVLEPECYEMAGDRMRVARERVARAVVEHLLGKGE